jgi:hypothetical protein
VKKSLDLLLVVLVGRGGGGGSLVHFFFFVGNDFLPFLMFTIKNFFLSSRGDRQILLVPVPRKLSQPCLIFDSKDGAQPSGAFFRCSTLRVGSSDSIK